MHPSNAPEKTTRLACPTGCCHGSITADRRVECKACDYCTAESFVPGMNADWNLSHFRQSQIFGDVLSSGKEALPAHLVLQRLLCFHTQQKIKHCKHRLAMMMATITNNHKQKT
jgi:hypothetical protein